MIIYFRRTLTAFLILASIAMLSCRKEFPDVGWVDEEQFSIGSYLEDELLGERFTKFLALAEVSNTVDAMKAINPNGKGYTCFLPDDEAFDDFIENSNAFSTFDELLADTAFCMSLVRYHIVLSEDNLLSNLPYGGLPDETVSGDFLTISFMVNEESAVYLVNNTAAIINPDIEVTNGIIHVINGVLIPVENGSYEWLSYHPSCQIFYDLLEYTGIYEQLNSGNYTVLVEPDSIYNKNGIDNFDGLRDYLGSSSMDPGDPDSVLYSFAAYHIINGIHFLGDFKNKNYTTLSSSPLSIQPGYYTKINPGSDTFDIQISGLDTTFIDWINPFYLKSNISTKGGAIHFIDQIMEYYVPALTTEEFHFYLNSNPYPLDKYHEENLERAFFNPDDFARLDWTSNDGALWYVVDKSLGGKAVNNDYIKLEGNFSIDFIIPSKLMPGKYELFLYARTGIDANYALIEVMFDGIKVGDNINLANLSSSGDNSFDRFSVGMVDIDSYKSHIVTVRSIISGIFMWDYIEFIPQ